MKYLFYANKVILQLIKLTMSSRHSKFLREKEGIYLKNTLLILIIGIELKNKNTSIQTIMQKQRIFTFLLFLSQIIFAQNGDYSRVKVFLDEKNNIEKLAGLGIEVDHGRIDFKRSITNDFSNKYERSLLRYCFAKRKTLVHLESKFQF